MSPHPSLDSLLRQSPSQELWEKICRQLAVEWERTKEDALLARVNRELDDWPDHLRTCPSEWLEPHPHAQVLQRICRLFPLRVDRRDELGAIQARMEEADWASDETDAFTYALRMNFIEPNAVALNSSASKLWMYGSGYDYSGTQVADTRDFDFLFQVDLSSGKTTNLHAFRRPAGCMGVETALLDVSEDGWVALVTWYRIWGVEGAFRIFLFRDRQLVFEHGSEGQTAHFQEPLVHQVEVFAAASPDWKVIWVAIAPGRLFRLDTSRLQISELKIPSEPLSDLVAIGEGVLLYYSFDWVNFVGNDLTFHSSPSPQVEKVLAFVPPGSWSVKHFRSAETDPLGAFLYRSPGSDQADASNLRPHPIWHELTDSADRFFHFSRKRLAPGTYHCVCFIPPDFSTLHLIAYPAGQVRSIDLDGVQVLAQPTCFGLSSDGSSVLLCNGRQYLEWRFQSKSAALKT